MKTATNKAPVVVRRSPEVTDAALLERIQGGDTASLGLLYDRHARALHAFLARVTSSGEAEDLVQITFMRASSLADRYDPSKGEPRAWLFGIASRVAQESRRSLVRRARTMFRSLVAPTPSSHDGERSDVVRALDSLTEAKRVVVVLAEVEGFSCQEVADMLDIPIGTVWTRLHHARTDLRTFLERGSK